MNKRFPLISLFIACCFGLSQIRAAEKPNFVVIFCDDLGYGDLGCFGHPSIATPHLDRMAAEGQKWTEFYVAACVCTPSRAALMTGRLPKRNGMCSDKRRVLFPDSAGGLPQSEVTVAKALKELGYATGMVGKWHLGHLPEFLPTNHGFDSYFGIPYSNDMDRVASSPRGRDAFWEPKSAYWNVPLIRDLEEVERSPDQRILTKQYTEEALKFIDANREEPFFLYLAHSMPHVPLFASDQFEGKSRAGLYGDVIEEIDWSVGQVLDRLRDRGLSKKTMVVFTSDNGPWLVFKTHGGSSGLLRDGKGSTWEGGMREPTIFWWPETIRPNVVSQMGSTLDLFPTMLSLAGGKAPEDRVFDGYDLSKVLREGARSPRDEMFYYHGATLYAVRKGPYKAHFITKTSYVGQTAERHDPPLLYHLGHDPSEKHNVASEQPEVVAALRQLADSHRKNMPEVASHLESRIEK